MARDFGSRKVSGVFLELESRMNKISLSLLSGLLLVFSTTLLAGDDALEQRLQRLERRVGHITELMLEVQALKRSNRELQGQIEEQQHALERLRRKQRELYLDLDDRMNSLQGGAAPAPVPVTDASAVEDSEPNPGAETGSRTGLEPVAQSPGGVAQDPAVIQADYDQAYAYLHPSRREYKKAIAAFQAFLKKYSGSDLADNALYWLGESYYVTQDNVNALKAFERVLAEYPNSDKAAGALLKKGYILDAMGKRSAARQTLQQVQSRYPGSSAASMAKARLKHMKK
jgi:tol-pal system protein YbgF